MATFDDTPNPAAGKKFMLWMSMLEAFVALLYVWLHLMIPPEQTRQAPEELVRVDKYGVATITSLEDLVWQAGEKKAAVMMKELATRGERVIALRAQLEAQLHKAEADLTGVWRTEVFPFSTMLRACPDDSPTALCEVSHEIAKVARSLSVGTLVDGRAESLRALASTVDQLIQLRADQIATRRDARPPAKFMLFWMNAPGVLFEGMFWSWLGAIASLIYHSARALNVKNPAANGFKPIERWVGFSKLAYGPVVTAVLIFALWLGLIEFGGPELRAWSLPLIGALIGFNVRKAVDVLDALSEWMLNRFRKPAARPDADRLAAVESLAAAVPQSSLLYLPKSLDEMKTEARMAAAAMTLAAVKKAMRPANNP